MIIVHDGKAHHDDFLATCVLLHKLNCKAFRIKFTEEHLSNPDCWVIDQGRDFNPELHNFDHHQIKEEICAFTMVLDHFYGKNYRELFPQLRFIEIMDSYGPKAATRFANTTEEVLELTNNPINAAIISLFSNVSGELVDPLYSVMKQMGESFCSFLENTNKLLKMIENGVQFEEVKGLKIINILNCQMEEGFETEELPTKKYCKINKIDVDIVLTKDPRSGGYRMISNNTDKLKFMPNDKAHFTHNSGFLVSFKNLEDYKTIIEEHSLIV